MEGYEVQNLDKKNARQIIFKIQLTTQIYLSREVLNNWDELLHFIGSELELINVIYTTLDRPSMTKAFQ